MFAPAPPSAPSAEHLPNGPRRTENPSPALCLTEPRLMADDNLGIPPDAPLPGAVGSPHAPLAGTAEGRG